MIGSKVLPELFSTTEPIRPNRHFVIPWVILAISILATAWVWNDTRMQVFEDASARFGRQARPVERAILERLLIYEDVLRGGQGLFAANKGIVTREQWRRYVTNLNLNERYPGILGVGFSLRVRPSQKAAHLANIRAEGFPDYVIHPEGDRPEYHSIIYIEPFEGRNRRAFGYDLFSEPARRAEMERARNTGLLALSAKVLLVQEVTQETQAGFFMYLPVYREGSSLATFAQRSSALLGFVYSPFRVNDLIHGVVGANSPTMGFEIYDGTEMTPASMLYDGIDDAALGKDYRPAFSRTVSMNFGGHAWTLRFITLPAFDAATDYREPLIVAASGVAISLLLFGITWSLANTRERAITLAKNMTAELSDSREQFRAVSETANDGIVTADAQGKIVYLNEAALQLFGYTADEMIGQPITLLMPARFHEDHRQGFHRVLAGGESKVIGKTVELAGRRKDDSEFPLELSLATWRTDKGVFFTGVLRDITERKRAEAEIAIKTHDLEAANRLKNEFLASMSHELRTPLNAIIGFAQLMHDAKVGPVSSDHKEFLGDILTSSKHLLQLINDVLDLAKIEAGRMDFSPEAVELTQLIGEVRNILQSLTASRRLTVEIDVAPAVERVITDPAKLKQILYNYLSNAIKFTADNGRITIRALPEDSEYFRLEVEDTGTGIRADQIEKLFVEFQQLEAGSVQRHQGTGLGLALTKKLVEAQGGRVGVQSVYGAGSLFYAVLPTPTQEQQKIRTESGPSIAPPTAAAKILVIDDTDKDLEWLSKVLRGAGYSIDVAKTGAEGLAKAQTTTYGGILLDLILPDMAGWEVLHSIRASGPNRDVAVIVITVVTEKELAKAFPIQDYLVKPASAEILVNSLRQARIRPNGTHKRILVVDDDQNTLKMASAALHSSGFEAVCYTGGRSGLAAAAAEDGFSAVVLDLLMPDIDGFEFLDRFREISGCQNTPVIVWTNKDITPEDRDRLSHAAQSITLKAQGGIDAVVRELERHVSGL
jgi:PAS domain S-box-containing protein